MTELTITPKVSDKTARFKGTVAAGEHVAVTIKGGAEWLGEDDGALTLRVLDLVTGRTLAVFPRPQETMEEDETPDAWSEATEDANDLYCELNLNTTRMVAAARHMLRVPVLFVLGDTDDPRTLYFRDRYEIEYWPERIGDTTPYDLDKWPKRIDDWTELVADFGDRLDDAEENIAYKMGEIDTALGSIDGKVASAAESYLSGKKDVQTAVSDPDAEGTALAFIATLSQNTNGEVTATKKSVPLDDAPTANSGNPVKSGGVKTALDAKADKVASATSGNFAGLDSNGNLADSGKKASDFATASGLAAVEGKIPSAASSSNQLADKAYIASVVAALKTGSREIVSSLPQTGEAMKIYMVAKSTAQTNNAYDEYIWTASDTWEKIGDTEIDLSNYVQKEAGKGLFSGSYNDLSDKPTIPAPVDISGKLDGAAAYQAWYEREYNSGSIVSYNGRLWRADEDVLENQVPDDSPAWSIVTIDALKQDALTSAQMDAVNSGATAAKVATWDGYAAQIAAKANSADVNAALAQKASLTDLPYRLVEPGKWEFSDGLNHQLTGPVFDGESLWYYSIDDSRVSQYFNTEAEASAALSLSFGDSLTATRPSLPGHLLDRAGNRVVVTGDTTLTLPALVNAGKARDFLVRLEISGSTVPTITFAAPTGETIVYETDGDTFPVPDEAGDWLYSFTESCVAHKFAVSLKKVNEVAAPQAQGGS